MVSFRIPWPSGCTQIGIRIALGAVRADVLRMVLGQGAKMTLLGVAIGLAAALGLTRLMANLLFGVSSHDPLTLFGVACVLVLVALPPVISRLAGR